MGRRQWAWTLVAGCVAVATWAAADVVAGDAQARPDFAGRWTSEPDPAAAPEPTAGRGGGQRGGGQRGRGAARGDMGSGWGNPITIAQDATSLSVEYAFFARGDMQPPLRFTYALDGSASSNTVTMGRGMQTQVSRIAWEGQTLVISTTHAMDDPATGKPVPVVVRQILSLESPDALVVVTIRPGVMGGPETTTRTVYRRL
jgi:hypothetical protein